MKYLNQRLIKLFNILTSVDNYRTSLELSDQLNVSVRTVKKDINELSQFLIDYNINIKSKTGVGYFLEINDTLLYNQLLSSLKKTDIEKSIEIPKFRYERVNYIIKKMLSIDYYLTLEDLMDELYVSRSTLSADMKEVREIFKDYNLDVLSKPNFGIILEGDEVSKRLCISEFFFHSNISTGYFAADNAMFVSNTNQKEISFIRDVLTDINSKMNIRMSDTSFQNFVIHILIAMRRWKFYSYVKKDCKVTNQIQKESKEYVAATSLVENIETYLNILLPETEIRYFALHFKSKHIAEIDELKMDDIELVEKTFYNVYHDLQHNYSYIVKDKKLYEEYLRLHIPALVGRLKTGLVMRNFQTYDILTHYLCSVHITIILSKAIESGFNVKMNQNEFAYLVLYTNLLFDFKNENKERLLILCGRGRPETITLLNQLNESRLTSEYNIVISDLSKIDEIDENKYDIVISTVPTQKRFSIPFYFLDNGTKYNVAISQIIKKNHLSYRQFSKYFSEKYYNSNIKGLGRNEIIKEISLKLGDMSLYNEFWSVEHIVSHETLKNVVFLHLVNPLKADFIYVGILKKPIIWNKQWIQFLIIVNINANLQQLFNCYQYVDEVVISGLNLYDSSQLKKFSEFESKVLRKEA